MVIGRNGGTRINILINNLFVRNRRVLFVALHLQIEDNWFFILLILFSRVLRDYVIWIIIILVAVVVVVVVAAVAVVVGFFSVSSTGVVFLV